MVEASTDPMREHQLNIRLSEEETDRLDVVARHYALNAAGTLRMLVKREFDQIRQRVRAGGVPRELEQHHLDLLGALAKATDGAPQSKERLAAEGLRHYDPQHHYPLGRWLNELRRLGHLRRLAAGYVLTDQGKAVLARRNVDSKSRE